MSEAVIQVRDLGKRYRIGGRREAYGTLRDTISSAAMAPVRWLKNRNHSNASQEFWALRDISFEVKAGEVLGIIGRNGAGKSTLLKILSRVTYPTEGQADVCGRVGSLLEVGTGFHPELTGLENIYLNGAVLGMKKAEIQRKFDEIVEFAEIGQFLETPVKRYSSGMYMRLAFAVAAHLQPDVLVIDEVLAVGDAAFQKKCLGKMGDVAKNGRTILFVSHNLLAIENLCDWVICLEEGKILEQGRPNQIISNYLKNSLGSVTERYWQTSEMTRKLEDVMLYCARVRPAHGSATDPINVRTPLVLEFEYLNFDPAAKISISFALYNERDILLFNNFSPNWQKYISPTGLLRTVCHIPGDLLNDGLHRIQLILWHNQTPVATEPYALIFNVQDSTDERGNWYGKWHGVIRPRLVWETDQILIPDSRL